VDQAVDAHHVNALCVEQLVGRREQPFTGQSDGPIGSMR
jgi:hypothetical protein